MKRRHATASRAGVAVRHGVTRRFLVTIVWVFMMWSSLPAQTGSVLAVLPGSARTAGMGGAGAAIVGDAGALLANPAGPPTLPHPPPEGAHEAYPPGVTPSPGAPA